MPLLHSRAAQVTFCTKPHVSGSLLWEVPQQLPAKWQSAASGLCTTQPGTSFCTQPAVSVSRVTLTSLPALSQLLSQLQGLGLDFKAISGLNQQLYQALLLHPGATVTTIFLWDETVQKALERACESWRQRISSLRVSQPMRTVLGRTRDTSKIWPPPETLQIFSADKPSWPECCWWSAHSFLLTALLFALILRKTPDYHHSSMTKSKGRSFFSVTPTKMYTHFGFLFLYSCLLNEWKQCKTPALLTKPNHQALSCSEILWLI